MFLHPSLVFDYFVFIFFLGVESFFSPRTKGKVAFEFSVNGSNDKTSIVYASSDLCHLKD